MRQLATCLTVVLLAILLRGCPFDSHVPLGTPQRYDIDTRLTGDWIWDDPKGEEKSMLVSVLPFNDSEYLGVFTNSDSAPVSFRAFQAKIGDQMFWNVNYLRESFPPSTYHFVRITLMEDGQLSLVIVGDKIVPASLASDAPGLRAYLGSHLTDPSLNDNDAPGVLRRPKPGEIEKGRLRSWAASSPSASGSPGR